VAVLADSVQIPQYPGLWLLMQVAVVVAHTQDHIQQQQVAQAVQVVVALAELILEHKVGILVVQAPQTLEVAVEEEPDINNLWQAAQAVLV
jgi:nucleoside permease NupC